MAKSRSIEYNASHMSVNVFLRRFILVSLFAIPLIPLVVSSGLFFPFITGKNFIFRILIELAVSAWVVLMVRDASYRPKASPILFAFLAFISVIAVADVFGENPYRSLWSNYERMEGLVAHLHLFAYFLVMVSVLSAENLWRKFWLMSFGANIAVVAYSFFQLSGALQINQGGVRVDATLGNATYLAVYLLFQIFLIVFFLMRRGEESNSRNIFPIIGASAGALVLIIINTWGQISAQVVFIIIFLTLFVDLILFFLTYFKNARPFFWVLLILDLFVLYRTETRGAILGLIAGTLLTALLLAIGNWNNKKVRNIFIGVLVAITLFIGLFVAFRDTPFIKSNPTLSRFASISFSEQTTRSRFTIWNMSFEGFKERPVLGWGQDNFIVVFSKYYKPSMWSQEPWFDRSHNVFFDWLIAGGLLGLLSYLALFGSGVYMLWRSVFSFSEKSVLTGLLGGYFFQNLFVFDNLTSYIMFFSVLGFISVAGRSAESDDKNQKNMIGVEESAFSKAGGSYVVAVFVVAFLSYLLYFANYKPISAGTNLIKALSSYPEGPAKNLEYFKNVFALDTFGSGEAREQLIQAALRVFRSSVPMETKQGFFDLAKSEMEKQIAMSPTDARYELYVGSFFNASGNYDEAIRHLKRAEELSPKKQMILFELGSAYINKGDGVSGVSSFKKAYDLAPEYNDAKLIYATGLFYAGDISTGDKFMNDNFGTLFIADDRIISAYDYRRLYDRVIAIRKNQFSASPADQGLGLQLADAYLKSGDKGNAILVLRQIISANPGAKEQMEGYINNINSGK